VRQLSGFANSSGNARLGFDVLLQAIREMTGFEILKSYLSVSV
jgi:hypothetical protein